MQKRSFTKAYGHIEFRDAHESWSKCLGKWLKSFELKISHSNKALSEFVANVQLVALTARSN
jgi:hypothetical protein